jgi:hypothetical protein
LEVTDDIFYGQDALPQRHMPNPTKKPVRISVAQVAELSVPPPQAADINGLSLDTSPEDMETVLTANGAGQRDYTQSFARQIAPQPVPGRGTLRSTEAFTNARMLIDLDEQKVLLSLSDSRTGTPRVGLGRVKLYDPAKLTAEGLAGALIKKYGEPSFTEQTRRGGTPLNRFIWGYHPAISLPYCLPQMNTTAARQLRDALVINNGEDRLFYNLAQSVPWPHYGQLNEKVPDLSTCQPLVVAEVSTQSSKLSLSTWLIDPSSLARITWGAEGDAPKSTEELVEGAADIDL